MRRREFLRMASAAAVIPAQSASSGVPPGFAPSAPPASAMTAEEHRKRLHILSECNRRIRKCMRKRMVIDYLPGQVVYNLGEYPCRKPWDPDEWDEAQLQEYSRAGVELVQVHEDWNDSQRLFGADKFTPLNDRGFRRFVQMCHRNRLKIIPYISTGYFESTDPDFRPEWASTIVVEEYFRYALCKPGHPGWRAYLLPRLRRILDEYGVDGLYNDVGYGIARGEAKSLGDPGSISADAAFEDLMGLVYDEVKRRGGIVKVHAGVWYRGSGRPPAEPKLYDYLWVGETANEPDKQRESYKDHPPYLVPCIDLARTPVAREEELYLHAIPYLQFPVLLAGRPLTGERLFIPGIRYKQETEPPGVWTRMRHLAKIWDFYQKNPKGPFSYNEWDTCPGRPEARPTYYRWLKLYRAMVEPGTWTFLEIQDSDLFSAPPPAHLTVSVFANRELYVVLANYSAGTTVEVETRDLYRSCIDASEEPHKIWRIRPRSLLVVRRA